MKYRSTRGGVRGASFTDAVLAGNSADGGLYVPEELPRFTRTILKEWAGLAYPQLAERVMRLFVSEEEISTRELQEIMRDAFSAFQHHDILNVAEVGSLRILEMWHGPTGAFKDLPLTMMGVIVNHIMKKRAKKAVALVGTLGDTGSAAIHSFRGSSHVNLIVLYPTKVVSDEQRLQMATVSAPNIRVYGCEGDSDSIDDPIHNVFTSLEFCCKHTLLWLNSINIGRIVAHIVHFIYGYLQLCPSADREVTFFVPSGALGNAAGGYMAACSGLPIQLVLAVNDNDAVHRCFTNGLLSLGTLKETYSSAMDTQRPWNIERLFHFMSGGDTDMVSRIMTSFERKGRVEVPEEVRKSHCVTTVMVPQEEATAAAAKIWREHGYVLCPHTAVGVAAAMRTGGSDLSLCLATATAAKFPKFVSLFDAPVPSHPAVEGLHNKPCYDLVMKKGQDWDQILRKAIEEFSSSC